MVYRTPRVVGRVALWLCGLVVRGSLYFSWGVRVVVPAGVGPLGLVVCCWISPGCSRCFRCRSAWDQVPRAGRGCAPFFAAPSTLRWSGSAVGAPLPFCGWFVDRKCVAGWEVCCWIGYALVDRLLTYPEVHNLSTKAFPIQEAVSYPGAGLTCRALSPWPAQARQPVVRWLLNPLGCT